MISYLLLAVTCSTHSSRLRLPLLAFRFFFNSFSQVNQFMLTDKNRLPSIDQLPWELTELMGVAWGELS